MFSKQVVHLLVAHLSTSISLSSLPFFPIVLEDTSPSNCYGVCAITPIYPLLSFITPPRFLAPSLCVSTES
jgi:hypothetical protein